MTVGPETYPLQEPPVKRPSTPLSRRQLASALPVAVPQVAEDVAATSQLRNLPDRLLKLDTPGESLGKRIAFLLIAVAIAWMYFYWTQSYWAPGHAGNNQNGYLAGGKNLVDSNFLTTGFEPKTPYSFVGWMWVMGDPNSTAPGGGMHYPKYPIGLPMLNAIAYTLAGGGERGIEWAYRTSPICMAMGILGIFFITRLLAGSFAGVVAMLVAAINPPIVMLTNNPYSHAAGLCFVVWGVYFVLSWWASNGWWRGVLAGFCLGYAVTIRYSDGLMLLPLGVAVLLRLRWTNIWSYVRCSLPILAWSVPVGWLVIFNYFAMGSVTGYDSTNESTAFTFTEMERKWRYAVEVLYNTGLYFVFPLAAAGMAMAFRWNWRAALILVLWFVPGTVLYMSYYWGLRGGGAMVLTMYLRFFTTLLPAAIIAAVWMLARSTQFAPTLSQLSPFRRFLLWILVPASAAVAIALAAIQFDVPFSLEAVRSNDNWPTLLLAGALGATLIASIVAVGRGSGAPLGMGLVLAIMISINMTTLIGPLERDHVIAYNLSSSGAEIRRNVPEGAVVFGDSQRLLNYLQFAGRYDLYGIDYFIERAPIPRFSQTNRDDEPDPIQPARRKWLQQWYNGVDRATMIGRQNDIMRSALLEGRRVFVVRDGDGVDRFRREYLTREFTFKPVARWVEPMRMTPEAIKNMGSLGSDMARQNPAAWSIIEVVLNDAPTPPPTTRPAGPAMVNADR